jgi:hypothetical protein
MAGFFMPAVPPGRGLGQGRVLLASSNVGERVLSLPVGNVIRAGCAVDAVGEDPRIYPGPGQRLAAQAVYDLTWRSGAGASAPLNVASSASARAASTLGNRWP